MILECPFFYDQGIKFGRIYDVNSGMKRPESDCSAESNSHIFLYTDKEAICGYLYIDKVRR